jgi:hypothetical protein
MVDLMPFMMLIWKLNVYCNLKLNCSWKQAQAKIIRNEILSTEGTNGKY